MTISAGKHRTLDPIVLPKSTKYLASLGLVGLIGKADRQGHEGRQVRGVQSQTSLQGCNCLKLNDDI
jgi:hypothetical protein